MTETERPLIDVARETIAAARRNDVGRHADVAQAYANGYDDGRESVAAQRNARFVDTVVVDDNPLGYQVVDDKPLSYHWLGPVNDSLNKRNKELEAENATHRARIAALEAFIAAQDAHDHYAERDEVKSLREKVAKLEADATMLRDRLAQLAGAHAALLASPQGTEGRDVYEVLWDAIDMMGDAVGAMTGPRGNCIKIAEHVVARIKELEVQLAQARADEIVAVCAPAIPAAPHALSSNPLRATP